MNAPFGFLQSKTLRATGIDICHETVRFGLSVLGQSSREKSVRTGQWHMDEVFVKINGERFYLWRAVDHEGEVLESFVTKRRDKAAAKKFWLLDVSSGLGDV